jgi:hypothetical protein
LLKASIALVGVAFAALAIGWITGQDLLLYASIACSALGGIALLRTTLAERKRTTAGEEAPAGRTRRRKTKLGQAAGKRKKPAPSFAEEELVDEPRSSVRSVRGLSSPDGAPTLLGPSGAVHPDGEPGDRAPDGSTAEGSVVDFRSRLAAALDTSSLEDELAAEGGEFEDDSLDSGFTERDLMTGGSRKDFLIGEDEGKTVGPAVVRAPGAVDSSVGAVEEEEELAPDWIRIDDLPRIGRSSAFARGSRGPAARAPSESPASGVVPASRPSAGRAKGKNQPSAAKPSPKKPAASKGGGASGSRATSKRKPSTSSVTTGRSAAGPKRGSPTGGAKTPSKPAKPGVTGRKPGPGRPPRPRP